MQINRVWILATIAAILPLAVHGKDEAVEDAQFNAKAVLTTARTIFMKDGSYQAATAKALKKDPSFDVVEEGPSTKPGTVAVKVMGPDHFRIAVYASGTCWGVREQGLPGGRGMHTLYAKRQAPAKDCTATSFKDADFREHAHVWAR
jgi:hypothetical protein